MPPHLQEKSYWSLLWNTSPRWKEFLESKAVGAEVCEPPLKAEQFSEKDTDEVTLKHLFCVWFCLMSPADSLRSCSVQWCKIPVLNQTRLLSHAREPSLMNSFCAIRVTVCSAASSSSGHWASGILHQKGKWCLWPATASVPTQNPEIPGHRHYSHHTDCCHMSNTTPGCCVWLAVLQVPPEIKRSTHVLAGCSGGCHALIPGHKFTVSCSYGRQTLFLRLLVSTANP